VNINILLESTLKILPWILPVIIGAAIGYITNAIAIKMLFRPLKEKRVFGMRVPFTPGIIPRQRYELSENIAKMVSRELITEEAVAKQLAKESFVGGIKRAVKSISEELLTSPIGRLDSNRREFLLSSLKGFLSGILHRFFNSRSFIYATRGFVERIILYILEIPIGKALENEKWKRWIAIKISEILKDNRTKKSLVEFIIKSNDKMDRLLRPELVHFVSGILRSVLPTLFDQFFIWLRSKEMRGELERRGKFLLRDVLDTLNIFQKFIISAGQFDRTLEEKMPEIIDEVLNHFEKLAYEEKTLDGMAGSLENALLRLGKKKLSDILDTTEDGLEKKVSSMYDRVVDAIAKKSIVEKIINSLGDWVAGTAGRNQNGISPATTLRTILVERIHLNENEMVEFASTKILTLLSKEETSKAIARETVSLLGDFLYGGTKQTLGEILQLDEKKKEKIDNFLTDKTVSLVRKKVPELIESLDISNLVIQKIDSLDVENVEKLILTVISKHLKWINIFGAILGGFIGFSQVIVRLLGL